MLSMSPVHDSLVLSSDQSFLKTCPYDTLLTVFHSDTSDLIYECISHKSVTIGVFSSC